MYKEKVRKFKCYYCSDCKLYAGSETKTIHSRRMKPNTKYCTGGKKVIIFRSDDPKVNVPKWCPKRRMLLCYGSTTSALWKLSWAKVCLRPTEFRFSPTPAAMQCGMRGLPLYGDGIAKQIKKCSLAELLPMQLLPYEILEIDDGIRLTVSLWNVSVTCGASASKAILHAKTNMKSLTTKRFDPMESCRYSIRNYL